LLPLVGADVAGGVVGGALDAGLAGGAGFSVAVICSELSGQRILD
jgi:hypothetical protein